MPEKIAERIKHLKEVFEEQSKIGRSERSAYILLDILEQLNDEVQELRKEFSSYVSFKIKMESKECW